MTIQYRSGDGGDVPTPGHRTRADPAGRQTRGPRLELVSAPTAGPTNPLRGAREGQPDGEIALG
jgi:hypothetical protein